MLFGSLKTSHLSPLEEQKYTFEITPDELTILGVVLGKSQQEVGSFFDLMGRAIALTCITDRSWSSWAKEGVQKKILELHAASEKMERDADEA
jgi:hypothetical protein